MIYMDDVAVWLHTQKGSILRGVLCGGILLGAVLSGTSTWGRRDMLDETIEKNNVTIAELNFKIDTTNEKIAGYDPNADLEYFSPKDAALPIAELQSKYGGYSDGVSVSMVKNEAEGIREELSKYLEASASEAPWFPNVTTNYIWSYPMREESIVERVPVVFECKDKKTDKMLAVVTGTYFGAEGRCGDFTVYQTMDGYYEINGRYDAGEGDALLDDVNDVMDSVAGSDLTGDMDADNDAIVDGALSGDDADGSGDDEETLNPELDEEDEDENADAGDASMGASKVTKKMDNDEILSSVLNEGKRNTSDKDSLNEAQKTTDADNTRKPSVKKDDGVEANKDDNTGVSGDGVSSGGGMSGEDISRQMQKGGD